MTALGRSSKYWTGDEGERRISILRSMWGKPGIDARDIAETIGKQCGPKPSRNSIIGKADRLGLKRLQKPAHRGPLPFQRAKPGTASHA